MSDSLRPHGLQQARTLFPLPSPRVHPSSCPLNQWCHSTISSSVIPFFSCLQSFPASWSFPVSQFFPRGGQSIGASASASILPMNIQDWFSLGLTALTFLLSKGLSRGFSSTTIQKHHFVNTACFIVHLLHPYMTTGKPQALIIQTFVSKVLFLLFNTLSRFVIAFLPRSKCLLISKLQSWSAVILEP